MKSHVHSDDETDQEKPPAKRARAKKKSVEERKSILEDDQWVSKVVNDREVKCGGCLKPIKLGRSYELKNWTAHRQAYLRPYNELKCFVKLNNSDTITSFFKIARKPTHASVSQELSGKLEGPTISAKKFTMKTVKAEPSIRSMLSPLNPAENVTSSPIKKKVCVHLRSPQYTAYLELTRTQTFGGISSQAFAIIMNPDDEVIPVPIDKCLDSDVNKWTETEWKKAVLTISAFARWEVDISGGFIESTVCELQTHNSDAVCNLCRAISKDESFKRSVQRKNHEAGLSLEERLKKSRLREIHSSLTTDCLQKIEQHHMKDLLDDKILFDINDSLKTDDPHDCFLRLWSHAKEGNLGKHEHVVEICASLEDRVRRESSDNPKLKYGIQYVQNVINYMMLMRGYGHNSHQQYTIFTSTFGGPSSCQLQKLRLIHSGLRCDNQGQSSYWFMHASILQALSQVPIPQSPPIVVALLPTAGKEDASDIHTLHICLITMAGQLNLLILAMAADGAATELTVQSLMDQEQTELPPLVYENLPYGI
ncbi:hypothetical protein F5877DRAFT_83755 [Lentinula edodes]|nr:hypothetical protein F5877DRAFT_83755 [Lentinula edodes]